MNAGGVVGSAAMQPFAVAHQGLALQVVKNIMEEEKELVSQIITRSQQVAPQIYDSHGQVVPTPGTTVDRKA